MFLMENSGLGVINPDKIKLARELTEMEWPVPADNEIIAVTVGGIGAIGMNMTLYGHAGRWVGVDAGVGFPDEAERLETGTRALIVDPQTLESIRDRLDGFIITHAHEDHIGAIPACWPHHLDVPIYCTPFAEGLIRLKLEEARAITDAELRTFKPGDTFPVGPFMVEAVSVTHSVPEPVAFVLHTPIGNVVHTGDWKYESSPIIGQEMDLERFRSLGAEGHVLSVLGDSTNAARTDGLTSEQSVAKAMQHIMKTASGAVIVCCFASNVPRIHAIAEAAFASGRQVAVAGRSMVNVERVANDCDLLGALPFFLADFAHLEGLDQREKALICTGSQGEENAILGRIARGRRNLPQFNQGDTVVLSSKVIPGNERAVNETIELLRQQGLTIITADNLIDGQYPVHVTGHATGSEIRSLYDLLQPRSVVTLHGTDEGMVEHALIASEVGSVDTALIPAPGAVLRITPEGVEALGAIPVSIGRVMD